MKRHMNIPENIRADVKPPIRIINKTGKSCAWKTWHGGYRDGAKG